MNQTAQQLEASALRQFAARGTRAVLLVDVVESVRLIEQDETEFLSRWLTFVDHVKTNILPGCSGRMVKSLGDGMLLAFDDVRQAIAAAFAIQHACHRGNGGVSSARHILLRMGLEISDVLLDGDDVYGRGVNRAARLLGLAGPAEIVVSANVRDRVTAELDADIEDLGECYVKHLAEPVRAYRIGPPGPRPVVEAVGSPGDLLPTLAVIPFTTRDASDEHQILGEVLAEELIRDFSSSPEMNVISRLSTTAFRGRSATLAHISANLNSNYVLSGEYTVRGERVTVDAELAEAKSGKIVWTKRHKSQVASVLSGRRELIEQLTSDVHGAMLTRELQQARSLALPSVKNYTLLLGAIALMHRLAPGDFEQARRLLEALIDRVPRQALPRAWLARWYVLRAWQGWSDDPQHDARLALQASRQALNADPQCSLALAMDGLVHTNLIKRLDIAQDRYDEAIVSNPNDSLAWLLKGTLSAFRGEGLQAVHCTQRALRLSPLDPQRFYYDSLAASACIAAERYDAALKLAQRSLRANRNHTSTLRVMAVAQWHLGLSDEARQTAQELLKREPTLTVTRWLEQAPSAPYRVGQEFARVMRLVGVPE